MASTSTEILLDDDYRQLTPQAETHPQPLGRSHYDQEVGELFGSAWARAEVPLVVRAAAHVIAIFVARRNDVGVCADVFTEISRAIAARAPSKERATDATTLQHHLVAMLRRLGWKAHSLLAYRRAPPVERPPALGQDWYDNASLEIAAQADRRGEFVALILSLCDALGWIVAQYGQAHVTADVIGALGVHILDATAQIRAQNELKEMKHKGDSVH